MTPAGIATFTHDLDPYIKVALRLRENRGRLDPVPREVVPGELGGMPIACPANFTAMASK